MMVFNSIKAYIKMINGKRIKSLLSVLKNDGLKGVKYHYFLVKDKEMGRLQKAERNYIMLPLLKFDSIKKYEPLYFHNAEEPLVTIVIPVYNQFDYTYNCLKSIYESVKNVIYEVIVADDNSTDMTNSIETLINGIQVIHNEETLQFVCNCNKASEIARGKYIVFLNNDTQVQDKWLESLVDLMENDILIGLAGSKLVYPNGKVQEAGGIVWKDASVLQYGNGRQPGEHELNFLRETDYLSGASIIIRRKLWKEIGGFDNRYKPAYYEDVDLAFEIQDRGYKVIYQPESEVIHFEGVSERMDLGRKAIIEKNKIKFKDKWQLRLSQFHYDTSDYAVLVKHIQKSN